MNRKEFLNAILRLEELYPNFKITTDKVTLEIWYETLGMVDVETFNKSIIYHASNSKIYNPNISSVIQSIKEIIKKKYKNPEFLFNNLKKNIQKNGKKSQRLSVESLNLNENIKKIMIKALRKVDERFSETIDLGTVYEVDNLRNRFIIEYNKIINNYFENYVYDSMISIQENNIFENIEMKIED